MAERQRMCSICNSTFPEDSNFYTNGKTAGGRLRFRSWCKLCEKKRVANHRLKNPYSYDTIKCLDCEDEVSIRLAKEPGILVYVCMPCAINRQQNPSQKGLTQQEADNASNQESA